ncbi:hypothetical protein RMCBS344292_00672 [Rhizopus microsporus]|nr:hypothetical protein RMCBS344292_00672 [Rhizopus microsporus]
MLNLLLKSQFVRQCLRARTIHLARRITTECRLNRPSIFINVHRHTPIIKQLIHSDCSLYQKEESVSKENKTLLGDCPGCGAPFQQTDSNKPGYLVERKDKEIKKKKVQKKSLSDEEYQKLVESLDDETRALLGDDEDNELVKENTQEGTVTKPQRIVCQRCHELQHHHKSTTSSSPKFLRESQQYGSLEFLKTKQDPLVVVVLDITDLPSSLGHLPELLAQNPSARVLLAANKVDILPASARRHEQRIRDWIVQHVKGLGLSTKQIISTTLVSARKGWGITGLMHRIDAERRPTDDVYLVGCTNVGKSALVNKFISQIRGGLDEEGRQLKQQLKEKYQITSSVVPGTTMGTIKIPLHILGMTSDAHLEAWKKRRFVIKERYMIDTPGIINEHQLIHKLPFDDQKRIVNQKEISPITFKLEPGKSLLLKPLIRIDLLESSEPVLFTMFSPLAPHITRTEKLPPAYALEYKTHVRPMKDNTILRIDSLMPMDEIVRVNGIHPSRASVDFSFAGAGWVALTGLFENAKFRVWLPKDLDPYKVFTIRDPPFLPFEYKGSIRKFFGSGERAKK